VSRKNFFIGVAVLAVASGIYLLGRYPRARQAPTVQFAPDFSLPQLNGEPLTLSHYRGEVVLLDFWATWCEPCRKETPGFVDLQNKYGPQGLQIVAVSMDDSPEPVREFCRQFKMNYPVVMGNAAVGELYGGILGLPIAFVLDRRGRIVARHIGPTPASVIEKEIAALLPKHD
jgi:cytochrome c biogenesis protein CcmG, thiol:disulfide interchange protein DsbE